MKLTVEVPNKKNKISYIGHTLAKDGLKPDPKNTKTIMSMPSPINKEKLQRFLSAVC